MARSDRLLELVEQVNLAQYPEGPQRWSNLPERPPDIPVRLSVRIGELRRRAGLDRDLPQRTNDAQDRIYEVQEALFRRLQPWRQALLDADREEVAVG